MGVLTENELRNKLRNKDIKELEITRDIIVTPSAKQYLSEKNIKLVIVENKKNGNDAENSNVKCDENDGKILPKYECFLGGYVEKKPEYMTQLYGNKLVFKDHKRIIFRGKIDSLQSSILEAQILASKASNTLLVSDLEEILSFVRNILRAEVLEEKLEKFTLLNMNEDELHEISHNPKKYFNADHVLPSYKMGELVVALNSLRSTTREVEICAFKAFKNSDGEIIREDIIRYLNRLSSTFYVMMLKCVSGNYK